LLKKNTRPLAEALVSSCRDAAAGAAPRIGSTMCASGASESVSSRRQLASAALAFDRVQCPRLPPDRRVEGAPRRLDRGCSGRRESKIVLDFQSFCRASFATGRACCAGGNAAAQRSLLKCCLGNTEPKTALAAVQNNGSSLPVGTCGLM
jgi:hypothetical protein